jgi:hypothetical protein
VLGDPKAILFLVMLLVITDTGHRQVKESILKTPCEITYCFGSLLAVAQAVVGGFHPGPVSVPFAIGT